MSGTFQQVSCGLGHNYVDLYFKVRTVLFLLLFLSFLVSELSDLKCVLSAFTPVFTAVLLGSDHTGRVSVIAGLERVGLMNCDNQKSAPCVGDVCRFKSIQDEFDCEAFQTPTLNISQSCGCSHAEYLSPQIDIQLLI